MATQEIAPVEVESPGAIHSAAELRVGDRVVYPNQGVCRIVGRESKEIAGQKLEFVAMAREEDEATILVPTGKVPTIGLRKVADPTEVADVFDLLGSSFDDPELDWKVRHRTHGDLMVAGGVLGVAEVLKGLQALGNLRPLPQKERERYDAARHLLVNEVSVALGVPLCTAEDYIDLALIPPPGVERSTRKPRRLATIAPRPRPLARGPRPAAGISEDDLELEEEEATLTPELGGAEPEAGGEEEGESAEDAAVEEEEAPARAGKPAAPAAAKAAEPKAKAAPPAPAPAAKKPAPFAKKPPPPARKPAPKAPAAKAPQAAAKKLKAPAKKPAVAAKKSVKKAAAKPAKKR